MFHKGINQEIEFDDTTSIDTFLLNGYELIYGNSSYDIYDFHVRYTYKILLTCQEEGLATFLLLGEDNLELDRLPIKSALASINFWNKEGAYFYNPFFFYKSDLCDLDYKTGVASFKVTNKKFEYLGCERLDKKNIRNELFETTENFKITFLDKEKKKKHQLGFAVNDKYIERRKSSDLYDYAPSVFPYAEIQDTLFLFDAESSQLYKFPTNMEYQVIQTNAISFEKISSFETFKSFNLVGDDYQNAIYLLANNRTKIPGKGRKKDKFSENQRLYRLEKGSWELLDFTFPSLIHNLQIVNGSLYVIYEITDDFGVTTKMLYKSTFRI